MILQHLQVLEMPEGAEGSTGDLRDVILVQIQGLRVEALYGDGLQRPPRAVGVSGPGDIVAQLATGRCLGNISADDDNEQDDEGKE